MAILFDQFRLWHHPAAYSAKRYCAARNTPLSSQHIPWRRPVGFALAVLAITIGLDFFLQAIGASTPLMLYFADLLASVLAGALLYELLRERQKRIVQRLENIAEMNHHIRNALEVISLTCYGRTDREVQAISESVERINWALKEILPKV